MSNIIFSFIIIFIIIYGLVKKIDIYDAFILGIKEGLDIIIKIGPNIFGMIIISYILLNSNIINDILNYININYIYKELIKILIFRPISTSSCLIILNKNILLYGVDNYLSRLIAIIIGSSDSSIYIIILYLSTINKKNYKYMIFIGLLINILTIIISLVIVK